MIYEMNLKAEPFEKMKSGKKSVELRLFDHKRRRIDVGDRIIFTNLDDPVQKIAAIVKSLHRYQTFEDLFAEIPPEKCGSSKGETPEKASAGMHKYYTDEQIQTYGVIGIEIELTDAAVTIKQLEEQKEAQFDRLFPDGMKNVGL